MKQCLIVLVVLGLTACSSSFTNRTPTDEMFPVVSGETLEQKQVVLPEYFRGNKTVLLLGYVQNAQFDIDRWLIGLDMTQTDLHVYEIPTISGMIPQFFETQINEGMRSGIPKELWKGVITVYEGGDKVQEFTGNESANNARVILLDETGKVIYFHDRGFSPISLKELRKAAGLFAPKAPCQCGPEL